VADDDVGDVSVAVEPVADPRYRQAVFDAAFHLAQVRVRTGDGLRWPVFEAANAIYFSADPLR
jgi:hypothetical protein